MSNNDYIIVGDSRHPIKDGVWVKIIAEIRKNDTGEIREYETCEILMNDEDYPNPFNWSENNYSCDCNRRLFFDRAGGGDEDWNTLCTCGAFSVNLKNKKDGDCYYREFKVNSDKIE